jgi:Na+-translocating ferredoxin:NAD+ oxidoreductase subunit B
MTPAALAARIDALLPQTQCTKCGYPGCRPYAEAIAAGAAPINQCPPGGVAGIRKLAALLGRPAPALNPANGVEQPLTVAVIDEPLCIGCTLCIQACPVDAIVGAPKLMHTVLAADCTGCDLCLPPCPMDCIAMVPVEPPRAWSEADADAARRRYDARKARLQREQAQRSERLAAGQGQARRSGRARGPAARRRSTARRRSCRRRSSAPARGAARRQAERAGPPRAPSASAKRDGAPVRVASTG